MFDQMQHQYNNFRQGICGDSSQPLASQAGGGSDNFFMLPVCINCGTRNQDNQWDCRRCGSSLKQYVSVGCTVEPYPQHTMTFPSSSKCASSDETLRGAVAHNSSSQEQAQSALAPKKLALQTARIVLGFTTSGSQQ